jgi:hypothetical protein
MSEPLTDRAALYVVVRKVRPLPGHPQYWECQCGILNIWLYADSAEDAAATAKTIIAALPYERAGEQQFEVHKTPLPNAATEGQCVELRDQFAIREQLARESGLALLLIGVVVGADDTDFEMTMPL